MTFPYPYAGPIALYNNLPINANYYQPSQFFISTITKGLITLVETTTDHNYVVGQLVRFIIPQTNGIRQLNGQSGYVISIPADDQVVVNINSATYDSFQVSSQPTQPQILAIGDINSGVINASGNLQVSNTIPGSYENISPQ